MVWAFLIENCSLWGKKKKSKKNQNWQVTPSLKKQRKLHNVSLRKNTPTFLQKNTSWPKHQMWCWETRRDATSEAYSHTYSAHLLVQRFIIKSVEWLCKKKKDREKLSKQKKRGKNPFEGCRTPSFDAFPTFL